MNRLVVVFAALGLSGCFNETASLGAPPPVLLQTTRFAVPAPPSGMPGRPQLRQGILAVAQGQPQSVRAEIHLRGPRANETVRRELVGLGLDPARLSVEPLRAGEGSPVVIFSRTAAGTYPCADAIEPGTYGDPSPSLLSLARCQQDNNLAQMLVDPKDLAAPPRLASGDGAYLVNGVQAWRADRAAPLPTQDTTVGNYDSGTGAAAGSAAPAYAAPTAPLPVTPTPTPATPTATGSTATPVAQ